MNEIIGLLSKSGRFTELYDPQFKFTLMERRMKEIEGLLSKSGRFTELSIFISLIVKPYNIGLHLCRCSKNVLSVNENKEWAGRKR